MFTVKDFIDTINGHKVITRLKQLFVDHTTHSACAGFESTVLRRDACREACAITAKQTSRYDFIF